MTFLKHKNRALMDICHLKNAELEPKHQTYKCRVVLRGDIVQDDSGAYAVFTEGHAKKCVERYCELVHHKDGAVSCTQFQHLALDDHCPMYIRELS